MKITIGCHCEKHAKPYLMKNNKLIKIKEGLSFVDPGACPGKTWDKIPTDSQDIIWLQNCEIYAVFLDKERDSENVKGASYRLDEILNESWHILKSGGSVIIPFDDNKETDIALKYIKSLKSSENIFLKRWKAKKASAATVPIHIYFNVLRDNFIVLTKPKKGWFGGTRKIKNRKTRKYNINS